MKKIVVAYDITDDRRRNKIFKEMKSWGERVQYSVFECVLNEEQITKMIDKLKRKIDFKVDSIRIYFLDNNSRIEIIGEGKPVEYDDTYVI